MPLKSYLGTSHTGEKSVPDDLNDAQCRRSGSGGECQQGHLKAGQAQEGMPLESSDSLIWRLAPVGILGQDGG